MKKYLKIIFLFLAAGAILFAISNFFYPLKYRNKCDDKDLFRYRLGIYKIEESFTHNITEEKKGGFLEFLGFKKVRCREDLEEEFFKKLKKHNDSLNTALKWKKLNGGLYLNKNGDVGFQVERALNEGKFTETYFLTRFGFDEFPDLKSIIDVKTFRELGNNYYKDKNNIYHYYAMSDGGSFSIFEEADYKTFEILGDCYAKDKNHIYEMRAGIMDSVDYKSFKSVKDCGCFAKDKNHYYSWDRSFIPQNSDEKEVKDALKKLDQKSK